jgi:hypothetical protein
MTDVYVYRFIGWDGKTEAKMRSRPRATLEAIKQFGDPIMESQIVVDDAELDSEGFFSGSVANDSYSTEAVKNEIKSLNLRAASRDAEALDLDEDASGARIYMLQLESRELRKQAQLLQKQYEFGAAESDNRDILEFAQLAGNPVPG